MLEDRNARNTLRQVMTKAEASSIFSKEEVGFIVSLVERFRSDIEKKTKQLYVAQGEVAQLKLNERIIIQLVENMLAATERSIARQKTMDDIRNRKLVAKKEVEEKPEGNSEEQSEEIVESEKEE